MKETIKSILGFGGESEEEKIRRKLNEENDSGEQVDEEEEEEEEDDIDEYEVITDTDDANSRILSSQYINPHRNRMMISGSWSRTYFTHEWPDEPKNQFLNNIFNTPKAKNDISIHVESRDSERAVRELNKKLNTVKGDISGEEDFVERDEMTEKIDKLEAMIEVLKQTETEVFDVSMYTTIRADGESELEDNTEDLITQLESSPALTDQQLPVYAQKEAFKSTSPIGKDVLGEENDNFTEIKSPMMGGALGAILPFTSRTKIEPEGVEFGVHSANGSPVIVDRWGRENGYNQLTIGKIGAGKSFATKLNILRTYASHPEVTIYILDPLKGFTAITKHLDGKRVPIGGGMSINPLEINEPSDKESAGKIDPLGQKKKSVKSFIRTFLKSREKGIGNEMDVITTAINVAYEEAGIKHDDLSTHSNKSPTMQDVLEHLEIMANLDECSEEVVDKYTSIGNQREIEQTQDLATTASMKLGEFRKDRELEYLGRETEIDFADNDVIYLDMHQQEGSGEVGLMMQILFELVYQRAKMEDKVLFCIDEAHYIMNDAESLDFLVQAVRHSRHYNLSINFITQTLSEFMQKEKAATIADQCTIKLLFKTPGLEEEAAREIGLEKPGIDFVRTAQEGSKDVGYSEALLGIDEGFVPIRVYAMEIEDLLVNTESRKQIINRIEEAQRF